MITGLNEKYDACVYNVCKEKIKFKIAHDRKKLGSQKAYVPKG